MIQGVVNASFDAVVRIPIRGHLGQEREIEAVIDTGFNGFLTLPPSLIRELGLPLMSKVRASLADGKVVELDVHKVELMWGGRRGYVRADATGNRPLIGMSLLHRHGLYVEVVEGGRIEVAGLG